MGFKTVTSDTKLSRGIDFVRITTAATVTLPTRRNQSGPVTVRNDADAASTVNVTETGADIGGATSYTLNPGQSATFTPTGNGDWMVTGQSSDFSALTETYSGTSSHQTVAADLTLGAAAGGTTGKFLAAIMGNVLAEVALTKAGNYIGGLIGHFNCLGANATTYPSGAVLGGIGDGVSDAHGAFVAYIDGDSEQTNAGAAFLVMHNNSTPGSGFNFGLDLYGAARDGYAAVAFLEADLRFSNSLEFVALDTAITANTTVTDKPAGSLAITSHETGVGSIFRSDGSKWQFLVNS